MRLEAIFISIVVLFFSHTANAEISEWKRVGWWDISFYSGGEGCSAYADFEGGMAFFIGLETASGEIDLSIMMLNEDWKSIEDGKEYTVKVYFGDEAPWSLQMDGSVFNDLPGLVFRAAAASDQAGRFVDEFMRETRMEWFYQGTSLGRLSLRGSRQAFEEVVLCTKSYRDAVDSPRDPFRDGARDRSVDPF